METLKGPHTFSSPIIKEMQEKFNKCWAKYSLVLSCAAVLDPLYKLDYVEYCYTKLYGRHALEFSKLFLILLESWLMSI